MAPRRSRKAGKLGAGAERRRQRRLEQGVLRGLQSTCEGLSRITEPYCVRVVTSPEGVSKLNLLGCSMITLPDSIGGLKALRELSLTDCWDLTALPASIGELKLLEKLYLTHCRALAALPATIGDLKSLRDRDLDDCRRLVALPDSIGGLSALKGLYLGGCSKLASLPAAIGDLKVLTALGLSGARVSQCCPTRSAVSQR